MKLMLAEENTAYVSPSIKNFNNSVHFVIFVAARMIQRFMPMIIYSLHEKLMTSQIEMSLELINNTLYLYVINIVRKFFGDIKQFLEDYLF